MTCPGSLRIPAGYRADQYFGTLPNSEGQCGKCGQWLPVDWNGQRSDTGYRTVIQHEVKPYARNR